MSTIRSWDDGILTFSLTFSEPTKENGFVTHLSEQLVASMFRCCAILAMSMTLAAMFHLAVGGHSYTALSFWTLIVSVFVLVLVMLSIKFECHLSLGPLARERITAGFVILMMAAQIFGHDWFVFQVSGIEAEASSNGRNGNLAETTLMLSLHAFVLGSHSALPIRWQVLLHVELASLTIAVVVFSLHGSTDLELTRVVNFMYFIALLLMSSFGKRAVEYQQRCSFTKLQTLHADLEAAMGPWPSLQDTCASASLMPEDSGQSLSFERFLNAGRKEEWLLPAADIKLMPDRIQGIGGFDIVMCGQFHGSEVAVRAPKISLQQRRSDVQLHQLGQELRLLKRLQHPNLALFYGACLESRDTDLTLVMESLYGQTLHRCFRKQEPTSTQREQILADVSSALAFLHGRQQPIAHGALKDTNIFVEGCIGRNVHYRAKLLDIGLSMRLTKHPRMYSSAIYWMAPELALEQDPVPDTSADVFSFGCVVFFVVTGTPPRSDVSKSRLRQMLHLRQVPTVNWPHFMSSILGPSHRALLEECCRSDPAQRPEISEVQTLLQEAAKNGLKNLNPLHVELTDVNGVERARESLVSGHRRRTRERCFGNLHLLTGTPELCVANHIVPGESLPLHSCLDLTCETSETNSEGKDLPSSLEVASLLEISLESQASISSMTGV